MRLRRWRIGSDSRSMRHGIACRPTQSSRASGRRSGETRLYERARDYFDGGLTEGRQILRFAAGDEVVIHYDLGVHPVRAGIDDIVLDSEKTGGFAAFEHAAGRTQNPWAVADRGDQFALAIHVGDELVGFRMAADVVGGISARDHHAIEISGIGFIVGELALHWIAEFAGVGFARLRSNDDDGCARLLETEQRVPDFHLLIQVIYENRDLLSGQAHASIVASMWGGTPNSSKCTATRT